MKGTLILLPNLLVLQEATVDRGHPAWAELPPSLGEAMARLDGCLVETEKEARAFLRHFPLKGGRTLRELPLLCCNKHTRPEEQRALLAPLLRGETWGLLSDAGLPCLADPGAELVRAAREAGVRIEVHLGPSAPIAALLASGLPAQRFAFHGYPPKDNGARRRWIQALEERSAAEQATQICIETPYRNDKWLGELIEVLAPSTLLAVAAAIGSSQEEIRSCSVAQWRKSPPTSWEGRPAVFLWWNPRK